MGKFIIRSQFEKNRYTHIPQYNVLRDDKCINCGKCAKRCIFDVHFRSSDDYRIMSEPDSAKCKKCLICIQDCPTQALSIIPNPEFSLMGNDVFTPEIINMLIKESETGKNPVSGCGYGGLFTGPGFDSFWTDMSEIVRPTRDGIHAREYISTAVEIGRKPTDVNFITFDEQGHPLTNIPPSIEINLPILFDLTELTYKSDCIDQAAIRTAFDLRTMAILERDRLTSNLMPYSNSIIESFDPASLSWGELTDLSKNRAILELHFSPSISDLPASLKKINPDLVVMIRIEDMENIKEKVIDIYNSGADIIHLKCKNRISEIVRDAHLSLVSKSIRDEITLIAGGSIAEAIHVPKTIILGADAVSIDIPIVISLECVLCRKCRASEGGLCPRKLNEILPDWGSKRIKNLMASWHNQIIETLGAMGLREISRLRGEMGRAIFFKDIEKDFINELKRAKNEKSL